MSEIIYRLEWLQNSDGWILYCTRPGRCMYLSINIVFPNLNSIDVVSSQNVNICPRCMYLLFNVVLPNSLKINNHTLEKRKNPAWPMW